VTVKVSFKGQLSLTVPQAPPPTFLFLPYSIVKKQTPNRVKKPKPKPESLSQKDQTISANLQFSPERKTSSLAAPPPSSVSGLIEDTSQTSQQHTLKKVQKSGKALIRQDYFVFRREIAV
jgi:hypothetical protein